MTRYYSSTAQPTTLSAAATDVATTIQVAATTGFPAAEFILALDYGAAEQELVKVTNVSGTTLTVVRGFDSTTAQAHSLGAAVRHVHSADDFRLSRTHEAASSGVHGATGALVGTSDAQALTNKDLTSGTNTFPASLATDAELSAHTGATAAHGTTGAIVGTSDAQTLTNKTVALGSNTVSGTTAQFNAALSDNDFATLAGTETLTNKTVTGLGAASNLSGDFIGGVRYINKDADEPVTSSTVMQNDDRFTFTVSANAVYEIDLFYVWTEAGGGFKSQFVMPAGANYFEDTVITGVTTPASFVNVASGGATSATRHFRFTTSATTGSITLQWAQNSSSAGATVLKANSYMIIRRVA